MSNFAEKQELLELRPAAGTRSRATLGQLRQSGGFGLLELEVDKEGPRTVVRRSIQDTTWRRVSGSGAKAVFERVS